MSIKSRRVYDISLGSIRVRDEVGNGTALRCTFKVTTNDRNAPNTAEVSIYGLNSDHQKKLITDPLVPCEISVGHKQDGPSLIFSGLLRRAYIRKEGENTCVTASAGDGDHKLAATKFKKSYAKGVTYKKIVEDMVKSFGFDESKYQIEDALNEKTKAALRFNGDASHELTALLSRLGVRWFVSNGALIVQRYGLVVNSTGVKITDLCQPAELCLKKLPGQDVETEIVSFSTLLEPGLTVGCGFELDSPYSDLKGKMLIRSITHEGDTHGDTWFSHIEANPI